MKHLLNIGKKKEEQIHVSFFTSAVNNYSFNQTKSKGRSLKLNDDELKNGTMLGIDSWADTCCTGKYAYI